MTRPTLLRGLDPAVAEGVLASARRRTFDRGEVVFHQGDPGASLQIVAGGHFALQITTEQGDVYMYRVFGPGDVFGRLGVGATPAVREMSVVCLDAAETFELFRKQVDELRAAHPQVNDALIAMASLELRQVSERLLEVLFVEADRRVRRRLVELAGSFRPEGDGEWVIPLTQEDVAAMAGTSRATVSRVLGEEQERGTIARRRRRIVLLDVEELARRAG